MEEYEGGERDEGGEELQAGGQRLAGLQRALNVDHLIEEGAIRVRKFVKNQGDEACIHRWTDADDRVSMSAAYAGTDTMGAAGVQENQRDVCRRAASSAAVNWLVRSERLIAEGTVPILLAKLAGCDPDESLEGYELANDEGAAYVNDGGLTDLR